MMEYIFEVDGVKCRHSDEEDEQEQRLSEGYLDDTYRYDEYHGLCKDDV